MSDLDVYAVFWHVANECKWSMTSEVLLVFKQEDTNIRGSLSLTCLSHASDLGVEESNKKRIKGY